MQVYLAGVVGLLGVVLIILAAQSKGAALFSTLSGIGLKSTTSGVGAGNTDSTTGGKAGGGGSW